MLNQGPYFHFEICIFLQISEVGADCILVTFAGNKIYNSFEEICPFKAKKKKNKKKKTKK